MSGGMTLLNTKTSINGPHLDLARAQLCSGMFVSQLESIKWDLNALYWKEVVQVWGEKTAMMWSERCLARVDYAEA